ncbi:MAG: hypothetical protein IJX39_09535 [Clostridia bacterium]|nr:hypothetical protein [Clostridia bacterium]
MKKQEKERELPDADPRRSAYMIAWRDRYIKALEEKAAGQEEENALLSALLFYALIRASGEGEERREVTIPKGDLSALLGAWECRAEDGGEAYRVRFVPGGSERDKPADRGEGSSDGAQGTQG